MDNLLTVSAATQMKLQTGGKGIIARQNLFCVTATAGEIKPPPFASWMFVPVVPVENSGIIVAGKQLGADGKVWKVFPDNTKQDITVQAPGKKHFQAESGAGKYTLAIEVNGVELDPQVVVAQADYCVGHDLNFKLKWTPFAPPYEAAKSYFHWHLSGNYYNDTEKLCATCSTDPIINQDLIAQESTSAWWVSGGSDANTPAPYIASIGMALHFPNGQNGSIAAMGKFNMYRPTATITPQTTTVNLFSDVLFFEENRYDVLQDKYFLVPGITLQQSVTYSSKFPGGNKWVQVANKAERSWEYHSATYTLKQIGTGPWLDNSDPYPYQNAQGNMIDSPNLEAGSGPPRMHKFFGTVGSGSDSFNSWLMFCPSDGKHWVPLAMVDWSWSGSQTYTGIWNYNGSGHGASGVSTESFPKWKEKLNRNLCKSPETWFLN